MGNVWRRGVGGRFGSAVVLVLGKVVSGGLGILSDSEGCLMRFRKRIGLGLEVRQRKETGGRWMNGR